MNRREMIRTSLAAIAGAAAGGAFPVGVARAASVRPGEVGVVTHTLDAGSIERIRALGIRRVRFTLYWDRWRGEGAYRRRFDEDMARARDAGLDLLIVVHQPPDRSFRNRSRTHRDFARFMADVVARYRHVGAWQLYNEADAGFAGIDLFGAHSGVGLRDQGAGYAAMLREVAPAIRAANGAAHVVANGCATDGVAWARGVIDAGGAEHLDAWALHCYGFPVPLAVREKVTAFRAAVPRGDLWVTEFGMESAVVAPGWGRSRRDVDRYHLEAWRDSVLWNDSAGLADRMYGYVLEGHADFGLYRDDRSRRPAADWLRGYNRG